MLFKKYDIIWFVLWAAILTMLLTSCKKDNGSYTYSAPVLPSLTNVGLAPSYTVSQTDKLVINPNVEYAGPETDLQYEWITYKQGFIAVLGPAIVVSKSKDLDTLLPYSPGNYNLELIVTEKKTGFKTTVRTSLIISAGMESGWLVLHTLNNMTDIDFITTTSIQANLNPSHKRNMFAGVTGAKVAGEGRMIGQTRRGNTDFNFIYLGTAGSLQRMHGFTFSFIAKDQQLFRRETAVMNPQAHISNSSYEFLINDGKLYSGGVVTIQDALYTAPFRGDYYLEPYMTFSNYNIYGAIVYDRIGKKFLYSTINTVNDLNLAAFRSPSVGNPLFDLNNMELNLLYMETGFSNHTYAFFKNDAGTQYKLNVFNVTKADDGNLPVASYDMTGLPEISHARYFDIGTVGNVALYATEKAIYRYDYSGTNMAYKQYDGFELNETITGMQLFKGKINSNVAVGDFANTNNTVLFVATWNGTEGKLYEFAINPASGVVNPAPVNTYTGFGKITAMAFKFRGTGT